MTTAGEFRSGSTSRTIRPASTVLVAGVPWPVYKLISLALGFVVLVLVGIVTMSAGPAVLAAAGAATLAWVILGAISSSHP